jgi:hypothetical protein
MAFGPWGNLVVFVMLTALWWYVGHFVVKENGK